MKFIAIGELMLRLSPPNYEKIVTTHNFIVNYGGAEANVAVSLANLGVDSTFFTVLPNTDLGKSCINYLKANDVHTKHIIKADGRMGLYYLEEGVSVRPSQVIYDRGSSAFAEYDYKDVDFENILKDYDWLHLSGITPALSYNCRRLIDKAIKAAKKLNFAYKSLKLYIQAAVKCTCVCFYNTLVLLKGIIPYHFNFGIKGYAVIKFIYAVHNKTVIHIGYPYQEILIGISVF